MQHIDYRKVYSRKPDQRESSNLFGIFSRDAIEICEALIFSPFFFSQKGARRQEKSARRAASQITHQGKHCCSAYTTRDRDTTRDQPVLIWRQAFYWVHFRGCRTLR